VPLAAAKRQVSLQTLGQDLSRNDADHRRGWAGCRNRECSCGHGAQPHRVADRRCWQDTIVERLLGNRSAASQHHMHRAGCQIVEQQNVGEITGRHEAAIAAKLYRAANRDADAHTVLAPAVEGFPPTQQFPELTEARTLLATLSR
jgi:hypothetical protein